MKKSLVKDFCEQIIDTISRQHVVYALYSALCCILCPHSHTYSKDIIEKQNFLLHYAQKKEAFFLNKLFSFPYKNGIPFDSTECENSIHGQSTIETTKN